MEYIAEVGWNFMGDIALAEKMITAASCVWSFYRKISILEPR